MGVCRSFRTFDWPICQTFLTCDWLHTTLTMKRSSVEQGKFVRSIIFLALGLALGLAGCQSQKASPASGPDAAAPAEQAPAHQPWVWRPWPFGPTSAHVEIDPSSGKVQLTSASMIL